MRLTLDISGSKTHGFLYTETAEEQFEIRGAFGKAEDCDEVDKALKNMVEEN